jgi:hypothetical protein
MHKIRVFAAGAFALLLVAACGSSGNYGDIYNGGSRTYDIHGTVDSVDTNGRSIYLTNVNGHGNTLRVYYDDRTSLSYHGRIYRPEDLERGDQVTVQVNDNGLNQLIARSMDVTYNARGGMASSSPPYGNYGNGSVISGTVRSIDTYRHTMSLDPGHGSYVTVDWVSNTPVYFNGRTYAPQDLEVGDQVNVRVNGGNSSRVSAQDITVMRSISGSSRNGTDSNGTQTVRGTVRYVDAASRTIQLESTSWMNGFQTNTGGNTSTIHSDPTARVDVSGQLYPLSNLERGDVIDVTLEPNGSSNYLAQRVTLVRNVRQ